MIKPVSSFHILEALTTQAYLSHEFVVDPNIYSDTGFYIFCGPQGSGKTLSMVREVIRLTKKWPALSIYSNMPLFIPDRTVNSFDINDIFNIDNGLYGSLFVIDELQLFANSLESMKIPVQMVSAFCQLRKSRNCILCTSQRFSRIAKPLREQSTAIFLCSHHWLLQTNTIISADNLKDDALAKNLNTIGKYYFFRTLNLFDSYDSFLKLSRGV